MSLTASTSALRAFDKLPGLAYRIAWRRLPLGLRRDLLRRGMLLLTRPAASGVPASMPIFVAGLFGEASGLGQAARSCHDAFHAAGAPTYGIDLTDLLMRPADWGRFEHLDGRGCEGPGTLLLHVSPPLIPYVLWRLGERFTSRKRLIAHCVWELPDVPRDWREGLRRVHEIWTPSRFSAAALARIAPDMQIHTLSHPISPGRRYRSARSFSSDRPFTVLLMFNFASCFARKNPVASIRAFRLAFGDDPTARLVIKYSNASVYPEGLQELQREIEGTANIAMLGDVFSPDEIADLYERCDAVISLHRSEGFGLVIAEAMMHGLPVVATNWSGNTDFFGAANGCPVDYSIVPVKDPQGIYEDGDSAWAEPDIGQAAALLRRLRDSHSLRSDIGESAARTARELFSERRYGEAALDLLAVKAA